MAGQQGDEARMGHAQINKEYICKLVRYMYGASQPWEGVIGAGMSLVQRIAFTNENYTRAAKA